MEKREGGGREGASGCGGDTGTEGEKLGKNKLGLFFGGLRFHFFRIKGWTKMGRTKEVFKCLQIPG